MPRKLDSIINRIAQALAYTPGQTGAELSQMIGAPTAYRRLSEIRRLGLAKKVNNERVCRVSGRTADVWYPDDRQAEVDRGHLTHKQEIKRLNARIEFLVNENTRLKSLLEHERRVIEKSKPINPDLC